MGTTMKIFKYAALVAAGTVIGAAGVVLVLRKVWKEAQP